jgi:tetratricopeptide (TPR) repeat protein
MHIASTTLLGPGRLDHARDALRLVRDKVTTFVLVYDPRDKADAGALVTELGANRVHCKESPWRDFGHARNVALAAALEAGADWALTVDTDELLSLPADLETQLASESGRDVAFVVYDGGHYAKERLFRLPAPGQWTGPTHEAFMPASFPWVLKGASFSELAKNEDALRAKCQRDIELLAPYSRKHPKDPRWHYYLGQSFQDLGKREAAIRAYEACWRLDGWEEESALAAYFAARCSAPNWTQAISWCARALQRAPWMCEPAWLAACASLERDRPYDAIAWALLATTHGNATGHGAHMMVRIGHQDPIAQWEGPLEVLAEGYKRIGDFQRSAEYTALARQAEAKRTGRIPIAVRLAGP